MSHIIQPRFWAQFFVDIRSKGEIGGFINAFIHFPLGALVIAFHNVWQGVPVVDRVSNFMEGVARVEFKDEKVGYLDKLGRYIWEPTK